MKSIATKLGLSAEASEDAVLAEVTKLQNRAETAERELTPLKNRNAELETENKKVVDEQIDADLATHGIKDSAKIAKLKPVLGAMKNREERQSFLKEIITGKEAKTTGTVHNRAAAATPAAIVSESAADDEGEKQSKAMKIEGEIQSYRLANRCSYSDARNAVRLQKPELFGLAGQRN